MDFQTLVVSGGSTKGIIFLGALRCIQIKYGLDKLQTYFGTSVGAMICLLLAIGYEPLDLVRCFKQMNFTLDLLVSKQDIQLVDYDAVIDCVEAFFLAKTKRFLTFQEMYETYHKDLFFVTFNYTQGRAEILSRHSHPNMDCVEAIKLSCAIPLLFKRCVYEGDIYVDGGLANNFPLDLAVRRKCENILALNFDEDLHRPLDEKLLSKINNLIFIPITLKARETVKKYQNKCFLINIIDSTPVYKLKLSDADILEMLINGFVQTNGRLLLKVELEGVEAACGRTSAG